MKLSCRMIGRDHVRICDTGFTILELLVVMAIISALLGLLLPALSASRERARITVCLSNCQQLGAALTAYLSDSESDRLPWYVKWEEAGSTLRSGSCGYGGIRQAVKTPTPPDAARPFNRLLGDQGPASGQRSVFRCPSDGPAYTWRPVNGGSSGSLAPVYPSAWRQWGNCYSMNTHWAEPAVQRGESMYDVIDRVGPSVIRGKLGGEASKFIVILEIPGDISFWRSNMQLADSESLSVRGWHGKFGAYTVLFLDGHATHEIIDTRLSVGPTWSVW